MTIADFINAHEAPIIMVACALQIPFAFFILYATADQKAMTPYLVWVPPRLRSVCRRFLRLVFCVAWIGIIFGAAMSMSGIAMDVFDIAGSTISQAQNDFGVFVSRLAGAVALGHLAWIVWKYVILWAVCGYRPYPELREPPPTRE